MTRLRRHANARSREVTGWHAEIPSRDLDGPDELTWQDAARCAEVDPEIFFPDRGASVRDAKRVCQGCEVREKCLEFALENGFRDGIWGGTTERQRRGMTPRRIVPRLAAPLCASGRHPKNGPGRCLECKKEREREREKTRVRDQAAIYARRTGRAREAKELAA